MQLMRVRKFAELEPEELKWVCGEDSFDFKSTSALKPIEGVIGQQRALKSLKMGVDIKSQGYNIFITGLSGTGKFTTIKQLLETIRPDCPRLYDYAYVNNFRDPDRPKLLKFEAGKAKKFKDDLKNAIKFLQENISSVLEGEKFLKEKKKLAEKYGTMQAKLMGDFDAKLRENSFALGQLKTAEITRPEVFLVIDDQLVMINDLDKLISEKKLTKKKAAQLLKKYAAYEEELQIIFRKTMKISREFNEKLVELEKDFIRDMINAAMDFIDPNYNTKAVKEYIDNLSEDILNNLDVFKGQKPPQVETDDGVIDYLKAYEVNIILDNSNTKECPVIIETSPIYSNLFGLIEKHYESSGGWYADFTSIKAGSLLRANGGYLVINALDAFSEPGVWKSLKRVLLYGQLEIQDSNTMFMFSPSVLKPEPIDINTKIIFIGNNYIYSMLSSFEEDFNKIFKIKAEFDYEMKVTDESLIEYARVIKMLIDKESLLEFDKSAILKIIEYGARYAGRKDKLTTRFAYIADLAREASFWASDSGDNMVTAYHVKQSYESSLERHGLYESKMKELIAEDTILIDVEGTRVGQVNGLAVYSSGKYAFGKPTRITASVSLGNGSIINVEREAGLSGSTHNKGVLIITGYFKEKFGRRIPPTFNASLVFEQGYGMIDGDSASIAEICALLSSISEIPLKQYIAITGSVNQKGDVQPIGGVNEKIEGFYDICKEKGLTGKQGVVIPKQNVKDLMLKDEVIEAVKNKLFHIYPVEKIEEAVEILTGVKAGKLLKSCHYQSHTVFGEAEKKLREMRRIIKGQQQQPTAKNKPKKSTQRKKK